MILYIPLEIPVRELGGHLLLATVSASRGHQVLIASPNDLWLYKRMNLLRKGCYLLKNVNVPSTSQKMYEIFSKDGFDLYCQEQEPSILWSNFEKFLLDRNIHRSQMFPFKGVFCWGDRDTAGYKTFFDHKKQAFFNTGSPRADMWHPLFASSRKKNSIEKLKPYILIVSNFGLWMSKRHWTEWLSVARKNELLESQKQEDNYLKYLLEDFTIAIHMVQAVKYLAKEYPNYTIVIRPHPLDDVDNWDNILGDNKNIYITGNTDSISSWISGASVVIQNGCTSALEAVLQKVPVINYGPERSIGNLIVPSQMGLRVESIEELYAAMKICWSDIDYAKVQAQSENILRPLISTEHCDAANKIMNIIENRSTFSSDIKITRKDLLLMRHVRGAKNSIDGVRRGIMQKDLPVQSYELDQKAITNEVKVIAETLQLAPPELNFMSNSGVLIG